MRVLRAVTGDREVPIPDAFGVVRGVLHAAPLQLSYLKQFAGSAEACPESFGVTARARVKERTVEEYLFERAALARARSERQVAGAVIAARAAGASWQKIGSLSARRHSRSIAIRLLVAAT